MPRRQQLRFLVEITVAHAGGPTLRNEELERLVGECIGDVVGVGEPFAIEAGGGDAVYDVLESRIAHLDAGQVKRLLLPY